MKVCLFLDHACNLRCGYCYNGRKARRPMPWDVAERGIALAFAGGGGCAAFPVVSFFGGEPLLQWDLLVRATEHARAEARARGVRVGLKLTTNATLLTPDRLAWLRERRFYLGLSLDGDREAHDAGRRYANGRSSYERAARNVRAALAFDRGAGARVIAVIHPGNVDRLAESFDALLALGARSLSMNLDYEAAWSEADRARLVAALGRLGERYADAHRRGARFTLNLFDTKIVTHLKGGFTARDRCDFGCEEIAVAPSGRLYPCDRLVGEDTRDDVVIGDVWSGVDAARRDALVAAKDAVPEGCDTCALRPRCMHWCGCVNHAMTGAVGDVSGLLCWFEQRLIEEADRVAARLYREGVPGFLARFYGAG